MILFVVYVSKKKCSCIFRKCSWLVRPTLWETPIQINTTLFQTKITFFPFKNSDGVVGIYNCAQFCRSWVYFWQEVYVDLVNNFRTVHSIYVWRSINKRYLRKCIKAILKRNRIRSWQTYTLGADTFRQMQSAEGGDLSDRGDSPGSINVRNLLTPWCSVTLDCRNNCANEMSS